LGFFTSDIDRSYFAIKGQIAMFHTYLSNRVICVSHPYATHSFK